MAAKSSKHKNREEAPPVSIIKARVSVITSVVKTWQWHMILGDVSGLCKFDQSCHQLQGFQHLVTRLAEKSAFSSTCFSLGLFNLDNTIPQITHLRLWFTPMWDLYYLPKWDNASGTWDKDTAAGAKFKLMSPCTQSKHAHCHTKENTRPSICL